MKLDNKVSYEMTEEITLTDTELEAVQGSGCGYPPPSACGNYGGGYPYDGSGYPYDGSGYPYNGSGYPSGCSGSPSYAPQYSNPFDTGSCSGSTTTYTVTTTSCTVPASSSCGGY